MKKIPALLVGILSAFLLTVDLQAQTVTFQQTRINSSPNPIGSGARALGMGGAFIAIADDATAASWNPGGLMQLERPEFSFVLNYNNNRKEMNNSADRSMNGMNSISRDDLNYFSVALPFRAFDKNMVVSLNYQRLYDLYDDLSFNTKTSALFPSGLLTMSNRHVEFKQSGALKALAPAFAIQLTPGLSVGATFNIWTDNLGYDNEWESKQTETINSASTDPIFSPDRTIYQKNRLTKHEKNTDFEAFNMNLGFLWHVNSVVTIGGVYKTPYTASFKRRTRTDYEYFDNTNYTETTKTRDNAQMHFPASYGLGVAFRLSDTFTTSLDVYRTEWSRYWIRSGGGKTSPVTGETFGKSHTHDTTQVRAGCEYLFVLEKTIIPVRAGVFYDPEPAANEPDDFYGFSLGTGVSLGPVVIDCSYVYRWGHDVRSNLVDKPGTKFDVQQHTVYLSMIYHF